MEIINFFEAVGRWADTFHVLVFVAAIIWGTLLFWKWPVSEICWILVGGMSFSALSVLRRVFLLGDSLITAIGLYGASGQYAALGYGLSAACLLVLLGRSMKSIFHRAEPMESEVSEPDQKKLGRTE